MDLKIENYCYFNNHSKNDHYNAPILFFCCRDRNWKFHAVYICDKENLPPEMYIEERESFIAEQQDEILKIEDAPDSNYEEKTRVCYTTFPWEVKKLRKWFTHTYLSDVKWEKMCIEKMGLKTPYIEVPDDFEERWLKANEIKELPEEKHFYVPIRFIAWDIETNAEPVYPNFNGWKDAEKCEIISITAYDSYSKQYHRFYWHPTIRETGNKSKIWQRQGSYYVPANKKKVEYNKTNEVIDHWFPNEIEMLQEYFDWFNEIRPSAKYGFNSEGGYRITSTKGYSRKRFYTGFDMPYLYQRCKTLNLLDDIQKLSPLPNHIKGVKWRAHGKNIHVEILGLAQIDFIYTAEIFGYHKKFDDFRDGRLQGFMSFFLGFGKIQHEEEIFELWKNDIPSDYDPTKPEITEKKENLVKNLFDEAKMSGKLL